MCFILCRFFTCFCSVFTYFYLHFWLCLIVFDAEQNLETLPLDELKKVEFAGFGVATGSRPSASKTGATSSSSKHSRHAMKITDHFQSASPQPSPVGAQRGRGTSTNKSTRSHAISNKSSSKLNQKHPKKKLTLTPNKKTN